MWRSVPKMAAQTRCPSPAGMRPTSPRDPPECSFTRPTEIGSLTPGFSARPLTVRCGGGRPVLATCVPGGRLVPAASHAARGLPGPTHPHPPPACLPARPALTVALPSAWKVLPTLLRLSSPVPRVCSLAVGAPTCPRRRRPASWRRPGQEEPGRCLWHRRKYYGGEGRVPHVWGYVGMAQFWRREAGSESRGRRGSRAPTPPAPRGSPHPRACGHVAPAPASVVTLRPPLPQSSLPLVRTLVRTPGPPRQSGTLSPPQGPCLLSLGKVPQPLMVTAMGSGIRRVTSAGSPSVLPQAFRAGLPAPSTLRKPPLVSSGKRFP